MRKIELKKKRTWETAETARQRAKQELEKVKQQRKEHFEKGFLDISYYLKQMYQMLTMGGDAEFEWIDGHDPFLCLYN